MRIATPKPAPSEASGGPIGWLVLLLALAPLDRATAESATPVETRTEIRFAFSRSMFAGVNENDARAAMKVYAQTIGDQNGLYINSEPLLLDGTNAIAKAVESNLADMFAVTAEEFLVLEEIGLHGPFLCSKIRQSVTEEYLLLTRESDSIRQVRDLKGRSLILLDDIRGSLGRFWLEVVCHEGGLGPVSESLGKVTSSQKATQVVLPVFFGKADACVVTRNGWEVMCELNPQLSKKLRITATSPPVLPAMTCFGRATSPEFRQRVIKAWELSSANPAYLQLMTLFKADSVGYQPLTALESTRTLMAQYQKVSEPAPATAPAGTTPSHDVSAK